jgi:hypothetical protein
LDTAGNRNLIAKDTLVRAAGVGEEDGDDEGAAAGCWVLDAGFWMLDTRCLFLVSGHWFLLTAYWSLVTGHLSLVTGHSLLVAGFVNLESYFLTHRVFLDSLFYHYNLASIFSMLFLVVQR